MGFLLLVILVLVKHDIHLYNKNIEILAQCPFFLLSIVRELIEKYCCDIHNSEKSLSR